MQNNKFYKYEEAIKSKKYLEINEPWLKFGILIASLDQCIDIYDYEVQFQSKGWKEIAWLFNVFNDDFIIDKTIEERRDLNFKLFALVSAIVYTRQDTPGFSFEDFIHDVCKHMFS